MLKHLFIKRDNIKSKDYFKLHFRALLGRSDITIVSLLAVITIAVLNPGNWLGNTKVVDSILISAMMFLFYLTSTWLALGSCIWWGVRYNIPWFWVELIFYLPVVIVSAVMVNFFIINQPSFFTLLWLFLVIYFLTFLACYITVLMLEKKILSTFTDDPDNFPLWRPVIFDSCGLQALLKAEVRDSVIRIKAENQYILVQTYKGKDMIRLTMSEAIDLLPEESGIRVHRSHWVKKNTIEKIWYEKGNPKIRTTLGDIIPVSRKQINSVKSVLHEKLPKQE